MASPNRQVRPYRGLEPAERLAQRRSRLLEAGLELLGGRHQDPAELTVRAICGQAGLTVRYCYESFTDKDQFVRAVYDWVIADITATTQAAVAAAPPLEQHRAGMANIVHIVAADPRMGRLVFDAEVSNPVLMRKRVESSALLAMLYGRDIGNALRVPTNERVKATAYFAVGGVGRTISAWLAGELDLSPDELVDQLASILDELTTPRPTPHG